MSKTLPLNIPLMENNITQADRECLIEFLKADQILTQSKNVVAFENEWSSWLGVKHSVFVNSGASANLLTIAAIKHLYGDGEIIVPPLTWVSDISSVLLYGFKPVFVDINPRTLGMNDEQVIAKLTPNTRAVFLTHILGYNALSDRLIQELKKRNILLIEDVCESHGATHKGQKLGSIGQISNFSFYYAHHMSTIEGGMLCTNDDKLYQTFRMLRSHGMVRESNSEDFRKQYYQQFPDLNPDFIFAYPAYNVRSTELNAVLGRNQLKRLDERNLKRTKNLKLFLSLLDSKKYRTDFEVEGSVNYAFTLVLNGTPGAELDRRRDAVMAAMREAQVEFRRGTSGGGNQLRQPYLRKLMPAQEYEKYPETDFVHFYGFYIGNYPDLPESKIRGLCELLNSV